MSRMILAATTEQTSTDLAGQAKQLREQCAMLYAYLEKRDRTLILALERIPSHADVEMSSVFDVRAHLEATLQNLAPGVADLAED